MAAAPAWSDLAFIAADSAEDCVRKVIELCTVFVPKHYPLARPGERRAGAGSDAQGGRRSRQSQPPAPGGPQRGGARASRTAAGELRPGDKIIQLRNNYDKNLFNGDIGSVVAVDAAEGAVTADFDGERQVFDRGDFGDLALAYCTSIHKAQGSEYPVVIIPLLKAHFMMLQRNLLYTAITRGRKKVFLVGEPAAYAMAVRNSEAKARVTHLREKLAEGLG